VGAVLVAAAWRSGSLGTVARLDGRQRLWLLAVGIIGGGIPFALFFNGLAMAGSPAAATIHKTLFLWVALLAVVLLGERLGWAQVGAMGLLLIGTIALAPAALPNVGAGEGMILAATLLWAVEVVLVKRLLRGGVPAGVAAAARMTIGSATLFLVVALGGGLAGLATYGPQQWVAIAITGVLLAGYVSTWYAALDRAPATLVTSVLVLGVVVTASLQTITTGALPAATAMAGHLALLAGGALIVVGLRRLGGRSATSAGLAA
jgi:drug/metabolite transporter (DMT)-like permease